jgi:hypothetical protein
MPEFVIPVALALTLGLVLGYGAGAVRAWSIAAQRRAIAGTNARLARFWPAELPARSAGDILAGRVRVHLGGETYDLPVLPRAASRRWLEALDLRYATLAADLESAGNDTPVIVNRLLGEADGLYEMLRSYDQNGVLPPASEVDEFVTDAEILRAVMEVWRAANPLAATLAERANETNGTSPEQPSSPPQPTAGTPPTLKSV